MDRMLKDMPSGMLTEWMAYTRFESEEMEAGKRRAADARSTEEQAQKNARAR